MDRDIDRIAERVLKMRLDVDHWQLQVTHAADDDGVWWFRRRGVKSRIQLNSSTGNCPFEIGADYHDATCHADFVDEAVSKVIALLDLADSQSPK